MASVAKHPLFRRWTHIRQQILNPGCPYHNPNLECEGLHNFHNFVNFVYGEIGSPQPKEDLLCRLNKELGWIRGNISWSDQVGVARTSSYSYKIHYANRVFTAREFSEFINISSHTIYYRLRNGQSIEQISGLKGATLQHG